MSVLEQIYPPPARPPVRSGSIVSFLHILQPLPAKYLPYALAILLALAGTVAAQEHGFSGNTCYEEGANCQTEAEWKFGWCEAAVAAGVFIGTAEQCVQPGGGGGHLAVSRQNENAAADQGGGSGSASTAPRNNASTTTRSSSASAVQDDDTENTQTDVEQNTQDNTENTRTVIVIRPPRLEIPDYPDDEPEDETFRVVPITDEERKFLCRELGGC